MSFEDLDGLLSELGLHGPQQAPPPSDKTFPTGERWRIEIPSVEGPEALRTVIDAAAELDVPVRRISQGSGIMLQSDDEITEMVELGRAHDIRGAIEVLQDGAKTKPPERDRFLAHIEREALRLGRLTQSLLKLARCQTGEQLLTLAPVPLAPVLEDVAGDIQVQPGVELRLDCPAGLAALADRDLIGQVVLNLATNAAQHTTSGSIVLAARPLNESTVALEVRDTGCGISADEQERIFERFYRGGVRDGRGFGLGLAIVRQAMRMLGGTVEIESSPGAGTTARVTLVAAEPATFSSI